MAKIIWSTETIMAHGNGYPTTIQYVCENCGAPVTLETTKCPKCGEQLEKVK